MHNRISLFLLMRKKEQAIDEYYRQVGGGWHFCGIFAAFSRQYTLSTPKTCICQKHLDDTPSYIKHVREAFTIFREERFLFITCYEENGRKCNNRTQLRRKMHFFCIFLPHSRILGV